MDMLLLWQAAYQRLVRSQVPGAILFRYTWIIIDEHFAAHGYEAIFRAFDRVAGEVEYDQTGVFACRPFIGVDVRVVRHQ